MSYLLNVLLVIGLTLLSGFGDSRGFIYASQLWDKGKIVYDALLKSTLGFALGIVAYWVVIKYMQKLNIISPEIQTIGWFGVTIIGIAMTSGQFFKWHRTDQIIAIVVVFGIGWLLFRTGG